jgi:hypothetical protein
MSYTVKKALELNTINTIELSKFFIPEHMLFFIHPAIEQESPKLAQYKKYISISD